MTRGWLSAVGVLTGVAGLLAFALVLVRAPFRPWPRASLLAACLLVSGTAMVVLLPGTDIRSKVILVVLFGTVFGAALVAIVASIHQEPSDATVDWALGHGVVPTRVNADLLVAYVREGHRLRLVCGIGGFLLAKAIMSATGIDPHVNSLLWLLTGYLVGSLWSEAWLTRLPPGARRAASLSPRRLRDYLAGRLLVAQFVLPLVAVMVAPLVWRAKVTRTGVSGRVLPWTDPATLQTASGFLAIGAPLTMLIIWLLQRHIVAKPQPLLDDDLLAADDAIRSSSVHLLSGTGSAIVLLLIANGLLDVSRVSADGMRSWTAGTGILALLLAFLSWRYWGHRGWQVRRGRGSSGPGPVADPPRGDPPAGHAAHGSEAATVSDRLAPIPDVAGHIGAM